MASYAAAAKAQSEIYSSLKVLWQFLSSPRWNTKSNRSRIRLLEYFENADEVHRSSEVPNLQDVLAGIRVELRNTQNGRQGCVIVVEDIEPSQVEMLGEALDIDPVFFAGYLGTDFRNLEHHALPLWATTLPSESASQESLHLHHQRPTRLTTNAVIPKHVILVTNGNVVRAVRRLSTIGDTNVALVRSCCSLIRKVFESGFWICLVLVDDTSADIVPKVPSILPERISVIQKPLHSPVPLTLDLRGSHRFMLSSGSRVWGLFDDLVASGMRGPGFISSRPSIMSLCHHPIKHVLSTWMIYALTMSRYTKHYEYSLSDLRSSFREGDLNELQTWRRRVFQSLTKLSVIQSYVEYWNAKESDPVPGAWLLKDVAAISHAIKEHGRSLETMIPVATSMFQLVDMRRSMEEASHVKQLTYLAFVFIPLSFVATLFSMADDVAPWGGRFWLYFAVSVPLLLLVLGVSFFLRGFRYPVRSRKLAAGGL